MRMIGLSHPIALVLVGSAWLAGCSAKGGSPTADPGPQLDAGSQAQLDPGVPLKTVPPQKLLDEQSEVAHAVAAVSDMTASAFATKFAPPFTANIAYDATLAKGFDAIQASPVRLTDGEIERLKAHGFVISDAKHYPTFAYGYTSLYMADLPLFVSADSVLEAVHRSYDKILESLENEVLIPELRATLVSMRGALASAPADVASADADVYLSVALALLDNKGLPAAKGGNPALVADLFTKAMNAAGSASLTLFGVQRAEDFSQFTPRGHYNDSPELSQYFKAMMWLGRIDFRFIETDDQGERVFRRRQVEGALRLRDLIADARARWTKIDATIGAFVGDADYMTLPELDSLLGDLGITQAAELASVSDARIVEVINAGGYGMQRIASHLIVNGLGNKTLPLSSSFALFGQRYVVDSHVFSNVVYDRVIHEGYATRLMPDPLDAAFAALGNDQAGELLRDQLEKFGYAPDLAGMRVLVDKMPAASWDRNLYNLWLSADRALSPGADLKDPAKAGLASVFTTEAWGRRVLNTQLASWAELRHDTLLYAKQSYTSGASCEFLDAYVEPYPQFFQALHRFADRGTELMGKLVSGTAPPSFAGIQSYFSKLGQTMSTLEGMATSERNGAPLTADQLAFINRAVHQQLGCTGPVSFDGWYSDLYYNVSSGAEYAPTIADVHTQPTDEAGNEVGRVLHVGTGMPRLMVVSIDSCQGARAYAGLVSSYYEAVTERYERLTDTQWQIRLARPADAPVDVRWMTDLIGH